MFSMLCLFVALVVSHFGFEGRTFVPTESVPGHCLPFTFHAKIILFICYVAMYKQHTDK